MARSMSNDVDLRFSSAGTHAVGGNAASRTGVTAAAQLGLDLLGHRAAPLTADVLQGVDVVFAMEQEHIDAVHRLDPGSAVMLLRPDGDPVPDPYGKDLDSYLTAYRLIESALESRLAELT